MGQPQEKSTALEGVKGAYYMYAIQVPGKPTQPVAEKTARPAALMAAWTLSFRLLAPRASAPIRSSCSPRLVGLLRRCDGACGPQNEDHSPG
jgi:hypothetical protein